MNISHKKKKPLVCLLAVGAAALATVLLGLPLLWWYLPGRYQNQSDIELPTSYRAGLFFVEPLTTKGVKLKLLTDTGGGLFLTKHLVERCGLQPINLFSLHRTRLPELQREFQIPEPTHAERWMPVFDAEGDGMLGQRWFAGGVWVFDYPGHKLILKGSSFTPDSEMTQHAIPLGFRKEWGMRTSNHPRFTVLIDGERVECLFDTGATVWLSPEAKLVVHENQGAERATSFAAASLFDHWRKKHPDWRVVEKGCQRTGADLIEVPVVEVGNCKVGPVWFTRRSDANLKWMSSFMDKPIEASMGGDFLQFFRVTLDYPKAAAYFQRQ